MDTERRHIIPDNMPVTNTTEQEPSTPLPDMYFSDATPTSEQSESFNGTGIGEELLPHKDGLLPITILGALLGMFVGTLPSILAAYLFGKTFALPFVAVPLCIYGGITLCKGCRDRRAIIITVIFSLIGAYLALLGCSAAEYTASYSLSVLNIPLITILYIGRENIFSGMTASSVYILIFLILGCYVAAEFFLGLHAKNKS